MARVGWQEITERFSHIDAQFVGCEVGLPQNDGFFTVSLYPWWEHPLFLEARATGGQWGFTGSGDGRQEVTVYPKNVHQIHLSRQTDVTDWDFTQEHPLLWEYEPHGQIILHAPLTLERWIEIAALAQAKLTGYGHAVDVAEKAFKQVQRFGRAGSFALGSFPRLLFEALCAVLDAEGIRCFAPPLKNRDSAMPVLFLIDDDDYIIADDFEIDVPEFVHKPEWFRP